MSHFIPFCPAPKNFPIEILGEQQDKTERCPPPSSRRVSYRNHKRKQDLEDYLGGGAALRERSQLTLSS